MIALRMILTASHNPNNGDESSDAPASDYNSTIKDQAPQEKFNTIDFLSEVVAWN